MRSNNCILKIPHILKIVLYIKKNWSNNNNLSNSLFATWHYQVRIALWWVPWVECLTVWWGRVFSCHTDEWGTLLSHCKQTSLWKWKSMTQGGLWHTGHPESGSHICSPYDAGPGLNLCSLVLSWSSFSSALDSHHTVMRKPPVGRDSWTCLLKQR